jgi:hypothetical protein
MKQIANFFSFSQPQENKTRVRNEVAVFNLPNFFLPRQLCHCIRGLFSFADEGQKK